MDDTQRDLERRAATGDLEAADRLRVLRLRSGQRIRADVRVSRAQYHFDSGELVLSVRVKPEHAFRQDASGGEQARDWARKQSDELHRYLAAQGSTPKPELTFSDPDVVQPLDLPDPAETLEDINQMYRRLMSALAIPAHLIQDVEQHAQARIANARRALARQRPPATPSPFRP